MQCHGCGRELFGVQGIDVCPRCYERLEESLGCGGGQGRSGEEVSVIGWSLALLAGFGAALAVLWLALDAFMR